jgi:hypothetical protein
VTGTLVSWNCTTVEITAHSANHAARYSDKLDDQDTNQKGIQVRGDDYIYQKHCGGPDYSNVNVKRVKFIDADGD